MIGVYRRRVMGGLLISLLAAAGVAAAPVLAATQGQATVYVNMNKFARLEVLNATYTITPTQTDMENGYAEALDAITVNVKTNSSSGATLKVYGSAGNPGIALSDLLIKSGAPGSQVTEWTAIAGDLQSAQAIWSVNQKPQGWVGVSLSLRVQNLWNYADGTYSNTLTFVISTN